MYTHVLRYLILFFFFHFVLRDAWNIPAQADRRGKFLNDFWAATVKTRK